MPQSALSANVLAGIKGGASSLRKAAPVEKKLDPKMSLLESIKNSGKSRLKAVDKEKILADRKASAVQGGGGGEGMFAGQSINAILERRKFLAEEESDETTSDEENWD